VPEPSPSATAPAEVPTGNAYDKYGSSNPVERRLMARFLADLDDLVAGFAPSAVLEVGTGEGVIAQRLAARWPAAQVVGLDLPDEDLAAGWSGRDVAGLYADVAALPFPDDTFDLVLAIEVLEHVPDPDAALRELRRVSRTAVVASVPREPLWRVLNLARGKYWADLGNTPGHCNHWGKQAFVDLVGRHLTVEATRSPLPWTMVSSRVPR
jgi:ubiquinone/menaquinone biosynthesis C-methylase UbiE